jgi:predicted amidohydrolase
VEENDGVRNCVFLVQGGKILETYYKRVPWGFEADGGIVTGNEHAEFRWQQGAASRLVSPLICADVFGRKLSGESRLNPSDYQDLFGAEGKGLIVVSAYGKGVWESKWKSRLQNFADVSDWPLVFCNPGGRDDDGFGGGGSGLFQKGKKPVRIRDGESVMILELVNGAYEFVEEVPMGW